MELRRKGTWRGPCSQKENEALYLELILESLQLESRLSKKNLTEGFVYRDVMSDIMKR